METRHIIYEGKRKILYSGPEQGSLLLHFKDNTKDQTVKFGEGALNNRISAFLLSKLAEMGVQNHFIKYVNMREQVVKSLDMLPFDIHVLNSVTRPLSVRLHLAEGTKLGRPIIEYHLPEKSLNSKNQDTLLTEDHLLVLGWVTPTELEELVAAALRLNDFLLGLFTGIGLYAADFRVRFGRCYDILTEDTNVILGDVITPQSCTLWNLNLPGNTTKPSVLSPVEASYKIAKRLNLLPDALIPIKIFEPSVQKKSKAKSKNAQPLYQKDL